MDLNDLRDIPSRISSMLGRARSYVDPSYDSTPGLRPQDDESMRQLIGIIRGNTGMETQWGAENMKKLGVDPRAIVGTMLKAPGQIKVHTGRTRSPIMYAADVTNNLLGGQLSAAPPAGRTPPPTLGGNSVMDIYPQGNKLEDQNTMLHEGIHAIQNNYDERPSAAIDESRAYFGSGEDVPHSFDQRGLAPSSARQQVEDYLRYRIGNQ